MLSGSIQSSVSPQPIGPAAVTANAGMEPVKVEPQGKNGATTAPAGEAQGDLFSGQLNKALNEAAIHVEFAGNEVIEDQSAAPVLNPELLGQSAAELAAEKIAEPTPEQHTELHTQLHTELHTQLPSNQQNRDQQPQLDAEQWLQTMLGQQQLQLQTRDAVDATDAEKANPIPNTAMPINGVVAATAQAKHPVDKSPATQQVLTPGTVAGAVDVSCSPGPGRHPVFEQSYETFAKSTLNPNQAVLATGAGSATAADALNSALGATIALAANASATTESISLTGAPAAVTLNGTESAQRVQSPLTLQAPEAKWGEQLLHALRDNVQMQIQQKIQNATIRLDPPELGSLEIFLSHESGRLTVQITASQADVARLIQATSERLRQELTGAQFTQVNVQTSADGQSGQQQSRERQGFMSDETILANEQEFVGQDNAATRTSDVLVTV